MKKILLSLGFVAGTLAASAQPLLVEDFDAMNVGNLATDLTGATPGQNGWLKLPLVNYTLLWFLYRGV